MGHWLGFVQRGWILRSPPPTMNPWVCVWPWYFTWEHGGVSMWQRDNKYLVFSYGQFSCLFVQISRLIRHANLIQLQRYLDCLPFSNEQLLDLCLRYYKEGLKLSRELVSTVNRPCDFYVILASHLLIDQYRKSCRIVLYPHR